MVQLVVGSSPTSNPFVFLFVEFLRMLVQDNIISKAKETKAMMASFEKHVGIFRKNTTKAKFKSIFLDRYDNHFNVLYYMWFTKTMTSLLSSYAPDSVEALDSGSTGGYLKTAGLRGAELGGDADATPLRKDTLVRLMYAIRARNLQIQGEDLYTANRLYGNGYIRTGRATLNLSRRLRWGVKYRFVTGVRADGDLYGDSVWPKYNRITQLTRHRVRGGSGATAGAFLTRHYSYLDITPLQRKRAATFLVSAVHFLRTVWYTTNKHLESFRLPMLEKKQYLYGRPNKIQGFARMQKLVDPGVTAYNYGSWHSPRVDIELMEVPGQNAFRQKFRHHNWRIHVGRFEAKFWGIKKTKQFWGFMRWFAHIPARGVWGYKIYNQRIDIFIVNHLRVRNLVFARTLIRTGHAFIGDHACRNHHQYIFNGCVISLSREAYNWNAVIGGYVAGNSKIGRRRAAPISFARPSNWGYMRDHRCRFVLPYGDHVDLLLGERGHRLKLNWTPNNYFHFQRLACSAWW